MKNIIFLLLLLSLSLFSKPRIGDLPPSPGARPEYFPVYPTIDTSKTEHTFDEIIKERGIYIAKMAVEGQKELLFMQDRMVFFMGNPPKTTTWTQAYKYYCEFPESWNIDEAFIKGTAEAKFVARYTIDNKVRLFTRGYLWGGSGASPEYNAYDVTYGVDCSGFSFGMYNLAGFCMPSVNSYIFLNGQTDFNGGVWKRAEYFKEVPINDAMEGDIAAFPGHIGVITNPKKHEFVWNASVADYTNYNGTKARVFRWDSKFMSVCGFKEYCVKGCDLSKYLSFRDKLYNYEEPNFCK